MTLGQLVRDVRGGDRQALARAISRAEQSLDDARRLQQALGRVEERPHVVGITGPPGVGKSTLINGLARQWQQADRQVGVLAIDPSSPVSGGALLGDRVRTSWQEDAPFFRSLASRGGGGALARATGDVLQLLAAAGRDPVLIETVGAGQGDVGVAAYAQTTVVVTAPGMGDSVQLGKAGLMEYGQVFVVNKADLPEAGTYQAALRQQLVASQGWTPPLIATTATRGQGLAELAAAVDEHRRHLDAAGRLPGLAQQAAAFHLQEILRARFEDWLAGLADAPAGQDGGQTPAAAASWSQLSKEVAAGRRTPHGAAAALWQSGFRPAPD